MKQLDPIGALQHEVVTMPPFWSADEIIAMMSVYLHHQEDYPVPSVKQGYYSLSGRVMPSNTTIICGTIVSTEVGNAPFFHVIQTSTLRLPRSNRWTCRVLEARSPISLEDLPRPKTLWIDGDPQDVKVAAEATRNETCTSETSMKPMIRCSMGEQALSRNNSRHGLGGIRDADHGRRLFPVRTTASGEVSPGKTFFVFPADEFLK